MPQMTCPGLPGSRTAGARISRGSTDNARQLSVSVIAPEVLKRDLTLLKA